MKGSELEELFCSELKAFWGKQVHIERLLDTTDVRNKGKVHGARGHLPRRPADFIVTYPCGRSIYTEVKLHSGKRVDKFYFASRMEPRQTSVCQIMNEIGGRYDVIVGIPPLGRNNVVFYRYNQKAIANALQNDKSYVSITEEFRYNFRSE